jgi:hypothetical protein
MKRLLTALLLALTLILPMAANATHSPGNGPDSDKVDGTVEDTFPSTLHVNAISNPDGTDPRGHLWYSADNPGFPFVVEVAGEVTCLRVAGNNATIGMRIDRSKLPGFPGEGNGFLFFVSDYGEPGGGTPPDSHLDVPTAVPPTVCPAPIAFVTPHDHGNFVVHDAT